MNEEIAIGRDRLCYYLRAHLAITSHRVHLVFPCINLSISAHTRHLLTVIIMSASETGALTNSDSVEYGEHISGPAAKGGKKDDGDDLYVGSDSDVMMLYA